MNRIELNVSRTIPAPPAEVYDVWLDKTSPGGPWFGCDNVIIDVKVDGLYYHAVNHQGRNWAHYGRFLRLERGRVIEHTWMSEATKGIETTVTITLEETPQGTLFKLRHADLPDDDMGRQHEEGWKFITGALAEGIAAKKAKTKAK